MFFSLFESLSKERRTIQICGASTLCLIIIYFFFFRKNDLLISPSNSDIAISFYTDKNDNGNSFLTQSKVKDSIIKMEFILKNGFISPYSGFNLSKKNGSAIDVSAYNRLEVRISCENLSDIDIYLELKDKYVKDTTNKMSFRHVRENVELKSGQQIVYLPFKMFTTPDWWYKAIGQPKSDFKNPNWSQLQTIALTTGLHPKIDVKSSISVSKIRFYRDNTWGLICLGLVQFVVILLVWYINFRKKKGKRLSININYQAVHIEEKTTSGFSFLDYIHQNFTDSELSLLQVEKQTGIDKRIVSGTISEKFHCNFKTYINQIRVNEAKRLLKETDLNINEIAYKVGFGSPGSFNRVFKTLVGTTPTEFQNTEI